ncbi:hypothetical protein C7212DRAFT_309489, partial [Tuber magnatum]
MESWFKWAGGLIFASFGAKFAYDASTEMRMAKKFDMHEAKFEKKLEDQERRLIGHISTELTKLRLEIRNDRMQDELKD